MAASLSCIFNTISSGRCLDNDTVLDKLEAKVQDSLSSTSGSSCIVSLPAGSNPVKLCLVAMHACTVNARLYMYMFVIEAELAVQSDQFATSLFSIYTYVLAYLSLKS